MSKETRNSPTQTTALTVRPTRRGTRVDFACSRLKRGADRASAATITAEGRWSFFGRGSGFSAGGGGGRGGGGGGGGCVCRRSAVQGTPLRSSLIATGCGMRRAGRTGAAPPAFTVKADWSRAPVWKSGHALRSGRGRKHANNADERSKGTTGRESYYQITVELGFYGNYGRFHRGLR
ncbi:hypothetical protein PBY51_020015 [Eleginops maclovinus]|uniref:Uncharacterized protein n=1 Tax=Eleginops maclovinus TaxID=56733 RepID=A0AAN7XLM7_ELEMC|nr:hypothetical protein PBY51_020015 [Eleginops maclovinus]